MEIFEFKCQIIPDIPNKNTGRIYSRHHVKLMTEWLDKYIENKQCIIEVISAEESRNRSCMFNDTTIHLDNVRGVIESYSVDIAGILTVNVRPIVDNLLNVYSEDLELHTLFIASIDEEKKVSEDDASFMYFYLDFNPDINTGDIVSKMSQVKTTTGQPSVTLLNALNGLRK